MKKKFLSLALSLALALTLCVPALAAEGDGAPTLDDFWTHYELDVDVPGVESMKIDCEPYQLWDYSWETDDLITDDYEYEFYNAFEPGSVFTLTNTAPADLDCYLTVNLTTYTLQDGQYTYAEEPGGFRLHKDQDKGFCLSSTMSSEDGREIAPGESMTFRIDDANYDGEPVTFAPDTIFLLKTTAWYPDFDMHNWVKTPFRIDEAGVAKLRAEAAAPAGITAKAGTSNVLLDGKTAALDAYVIEGNNYIKLRDFAQMVSGTGKQFDVTWNETQNAIELTGGKAYTAVGGELTPGDGTDKPAALNTSTIYKDGATVDLTAYTINQNNYFKLRDLCAAFDIFVGWDGATSTISIDTTKGYVAE